MGSQQALAAADDAELGWKGDGGDRGYWVEDERDFDPKDTHTHKKSPPVD